MKKKKIKPSKHVKLFRLNMQKTIARYLLKDNSQYTPPSLVLVHGMSIDYSCLNPKSYLDHPVSIKCQCCLKEPPYSINESPSPKCSKKGTICWGEKKSNSNIRFPSLLT